jgi:hypothetical protein
MTGVVSTIMSGFAEMGAAFAGGFVSAFSCGLTELT